MPRLLSRWLRRQRLRVCSKNWLKPGLQLEGSGSWQCDLVEPGGRPANRQDRQVMETWRSWDGLGLTSRERCKKPVFSQGCQDRQVIPRPPSNGTRALSVIRDRNT